MTNQLTPKNAYLPVYHRNVERNERTFVGLLACQGPNGRANIYLIFFHISFVQLITTHMEIYTKTL